jgi:hypothetical protein
MYLYRTVKKRDTYYIVAIILDWRCHFLSLSLSLSSPIMIYIWQMGKVVLGILVANIIYHIFMHTFIEIALNIFLVLIIIFLILKQLYVMFDV